MTDIVHIQRPAGAVSRARPPASPRWSWNTRLLGVVFIGLLLVLWEIAAARRQLRARGGFAIGVGDVGHAAPTFFRPSSANSCARSRAR